MKVRLPKTAAGCPSITCRHSCRGVKSMANALGQEPVQVPHWMQALDHLAHVAPDDQSNAVTSLHAVLTTRS